MHPKIATALHSANARVSVCVITLSLRGPISVTSIALGSRVEHSSFKVGAGFNIAV